MNRLLKLDYDQLPLETYSTCFWYFVSIFHIPHLDVAGPQLRSEPQQRTCPLLQQALRPHQQHVSVQHLILQQGGPESVQDQRKRARDVRLRPESVVLSEEAGERAGRHCRRPGGVPADNTRNFSICTNTASTLSGPVVAHVRYSGPRVYRSVSGIRPR